MNNNINKIFDSIKASGELKEKAYRKIKNRKNYRKIFIPLSLAIANILVIFMLCSHNEKPMLSPKVYNEKADITGAGVTRDSEIYSTEKSSTDLATTPQVETITPNDNSTSYIIISSLAGIAIGGSIMYIIKVIKHS